MKRTGDLDIRLGHSDFALTFNQGNFTNPTVTSPSRNPKIYDYYQYSATLKSNNIVIYNVTQPNINDEAQFDSRPVIPSTSGDGTFIAQIKISGISNPSGTAGLQWRRSGDNHTIVNRLYMTSPDPSFAYNNEEITSVGTYYDPTDYSLPVQLVSFSADFDKNNIVLKWTTESEINNLGFNIYRSESEEGPFQKINGELIKGAGNSTTHYDYSYVDNRVEENTTYYYKIEDVDIHGKSVFHGPFNVFVESVLPEHYGLEQNYPNPFNPITSITLQLPQQEKVELLIFNQVGQVIRHLANTEMQAGYPQVIWDGKNDFGEPVASGIYLCQMAAGEYRNTIKMLLLK